MLSWLRNFWYHDTIDEMQRKMLREVWFAWRWSPRFWIDNSRKIQQQVFAWVNLHTGEEFVTGVPING